ncbi:MAG: GntR family transcriptional regulator [Casimicrobiaceae bacterium]
MSTTPRGDRAPLGHRTMALAAADELRRRILSGELPEGLQLKQDALAKDFGMSRIPIREALVQLESEGFVKILAHRGAQVSVLSHQEISELFGLRALLEPRLLRLSAPRLGAEDYAAIDRINAEYRAEIEAMNPGRWGELNTRLHLTLMARAEQPRTLAIVTALLQNTDRYTRMQLSLTGSGRARAEKEHSSIVRLCRSGDVAGASKLLTAHILHAEEMLVAFIKARAPGAVADAGR